MPFADLYHRQATLLIRALPYVAEETCFALKGGSAINLFIRNLPRLSVDIDLTYLPVEPRPASLKAIDAVMKRIARRARRHRGAQVTEIESERRSPSCWCAGGVQIKIEVTPVMRGCVFDPATCSVAQAVEDTFGFAEIQLVSFADLYAGKIVAALDRQHPRDFFDVRDLLANKQCHRGKTSRTYRSGRPAQAAFLRRRVHPGELVGARTEAADRQLLLRANRSVQEQAKARLIDPGQGRNLLPDSRRS